MRALASTPTPSTSQRLTPCPPRLQRFIQGVRMGKLGTAFGVFDGHGGVLAAEYATKHLTNNVLRMHQQQKGGGSRNRDAVDARRTMHALQEAFDVTDRELLQLACRKNFSDGTTALLLLFAGTELAPDFDGDPAAAETALTLFTAHVSDCRAVLCRGCAAVRLTNDHRPDRKDEQRRIREAGGGVFQVNGIWRCCSAAGAAKAVDARAGFGENDTHLYLSCSRSLGDPELKINAGKPILSSLPEVSQHLLQPDDLFVVVACDGVWDVLTDQQAVDIVLRNWGDPAAAASTVVRTALSSGSGDNVTAQVVMFSWKAQLGAAMAKKRDGERAAEEAEARKPKPKVEVDEGDVDMFG